jgi:hypothetical protein
MRLVHGASAYYRTSWLGLTLFAECDSPRRKWQRQARHLLVAALLAGCAGAADDTAVPDCERSPYELERTRYRCTSDGELQTLDCGEWQTLWVCDAPEPCSPGPEPGCR